MNCSLRGDPKNCGIGITSFKQSIVCFMLSKEIVPPKAWISSKLSELGLCCITCSLDLYSHLSIPKFDGSHFTILNCFVKYKICTHLNSVHCTVFCTVLTTVFSVLYSILCTGFCTVFNDWVYTPTTQGYKCVWPEEFHGHREQIWWMLGVLMSDGQCF